MIYNNITKAIFLERPNRFVATCLLAGSTVTVHVKNTGRCRELLIKGVTVYLEDAASPTRKTQYSLVAVEKNGRLINMDSQAPNIATGEALSEGRIITKDLGTSLKFIKKETTYKSSRFDFYAESVCHKIFMEVKGVTLENNNVAMFPDAPTERGLKHVLELTNAMKNGFTAYILFVIQMENVDYFTPNKITHNAFAEALKIAKSEGVRIIAYDCLVSPASMALNKEVEVKL